MFCSDQPKTELSIFCLKSVSPSFLFFLKMSFPCSGDGYIDMKELKTVTMLLGTMLTKEELDDFMAEADAVCNVTSVSTSMFIFIKTF